MHSITIKILKRLSKYSLSNEDKIFINNIISTATSDAYQEGINNYENPCGCGQPSCSFCN